MNLRVQCRAIFAVLLLVSAAFLLNGYLRYSTTAPHGVDEQMDRPFEDRQAIAPAADATTVILTRGFADHDESAALLAVAPNGRPLYYDASLSHYWDVEPSPASDATVVYVGQTVEDGRELNVVERVDLATGATDRLYERADAGQWRTIDRIDDTHLVVGDAETGRMFVLDLTSGTEEWEWRTGSFRSDLAGKQDAIKLNDVTALDDGRFLVSLFSKDQSVFVRHNGTVQTEWALGELMEHSVLFHPRDLEYVPADQGGPAVLAADYGNDRAVEFQRDGDEWVQSWVWDTRRLEGTTDVERLPGGRTLVANGKGDEVLVLSPNGTVTWSVGVIEPVDVERLPGDGTGSSAAADGLQSVEERDGSPDVPLNRYVRSGLSKFGLYGIFDWLLPYWVRQRDLLAAALFTGAAAGWLLTEAWWRRAAVAASVSELTTRWRSEGR